MLIHYNDAKRITAIYGVSQACKSQQSCSGHSDKEIIAKCPGKQDVQTYSLSPLPSLQQHWYQEKKSVITDTSTGKLLHPPVSHLSQHQWLYLIFPSSCFWHFPSWRTTAVTLHLIKTRPTPYEEMLSMPLFLCLEDRYPIHHISPCKFTTCAHPSVRSDLLLWTQWKYGATSEISWPHGLGKYLLVC